MNKLMFEKAKEANKLSYSPYSNFSVSAAVLLKNGEIITGVNIENASYGLAMCAERCTLFRTYASGYKKDDIVSILIYVPGNKTLPYPCGACRQVMNELMNKKCPVYVCNDKDFKEHTVENLLPYSFDKEDLI